MPCLPHALPLPTRRDPRLCVPAVQSSGPDPEHLSRLLPFYYVRSWVFSRKELPSAVGLVESDGDGAGRVGGTESVPFPCVQHSSHLLCFWRLTPAVGKGARTAAPFWKRKGADLEATTLRGEITRDQRQKRNLIRRSNAILTVSLGKKKWIYAVMAHFIQK